MTSKSWSRASPNAGASGARSEPPPGFFQAVVTYTKQSNEPVTLVYSHGNCTEDMRQTEKWSVVEASEAGDATFQNKTNRDRIINWFESMLLDQFEVPKEINEIKHFPKFETPNGVAEVVIRGIKAQIAWSWSPWLLFPTQASKLTQKPEYFSLTDSEREDSITSQERRRRRVRNRGPIPAGQASKRGRSRNREPRPQTDDTSLRASTWHEPPLQPTTMSSGRTENTTHHPTAETAETTGATEKDARPTRRWVPAAALAAGLSAAGLYAAPRSFAAKKNHGGKAQSSPSARSTK